MVGLAGGEPATCGLGNRRSIHLSYSPAIGSLARHFGVWSDEEPCKWQETTSLGAKSIFNTKDQRTRRKRSRRYQERRLLKTRITWFPGERRADWRCAIPGAGRSLHARKRRCFARVALAAPTNPSPPRRAARRFDPEARRPPSPSAGVAIPSAHFRVAVCVARRRR